MREECLTQNEKKNDERKETTIKLTSEINLFLEWMCYFN
jgi:hypothetical protein